MTAAQAGGAGGGGQAVVDEGLRFLEGLASNTEVADALRTTAAANASTIGRAKRAKRLRLAVVGEFSSGKSTLINALLGTEILASDIEPTTAVPTRLTWGPAFQVEIHAGGQVQRLYKCDIDDDPRRRSRNVLMRLRKGEIPRFLEPNGSLTPQARDAAARFVKQHTTERGRRGTIDEVVIVLPTPYLRGAIDIIDTPGFNPGLDEAAHKRHHEITLSCVERSHLALFIIDGRNPMKSTEQDYLELFAPYLSRVFFVVNKMDALIDDDDDDDEAIDTMEYVQDELPAKFGVSPEGVHVTFVTSKRDVDEAAEPYAEALTRLRSDVVGFMQLSRERILLEQTARLVTKAADDVQRAAETQHQAQRQRLAQLQSMRITDRATMVQRVTQTAQAAFRDAATPFLNDAHVRIKRARKRAMGFYKSELANVEQKAELEQAAHSAAVYVGNEIFADEVQEMIVDGLAGCIDASLQAMHAEFEGLYANARIQQPGRMKRREVRRTARDLFTTQIHGDRASEAVAKEQQKGKMYEGGAGVAGGVIGALVGGPIGFAIGANLGRGLGMLLGPSLETMKEKACKQQKKVLKEAGAQFYSYAHAAAQGNDRRFMSLLDRTAQHQVRVYSDKVQELIDENQRAVARTKSALARLTTTSAKAKSLSEQAIHQASAIRNELTQGAVPKHTSHSKLVLDRDALDRMVTSLVPAMVHGAGEVPAKLTRLLSSKNGEWLAGINDDQRASLDRGLALESLGVSLGVMGSRPDSAATINTPDWAPHLGLNPVDLAMLFPNTAVRAPEDLTRLCAEHPTGDSTALEAFDTSTRLDGWCERDINAAVRTLRDAIDFWTPVLPAHRLAELEQWSHEADAYKETIVDRIAALRTRRRRFKAFAALAASVLVVSGGALGLRACAQMVPDEPVPAVAEVDESPVVLQDLSDKAQGTLAAVVDEPTASPALASPTSSTSKPKRNVNPTTSPSESGATKADERPSRNIEIDRTAAQAAASQPTIGNAPGEAESTPSVSHEPAGRLAYLGEATTVAASVSGGEGCTVRLRYQLDGEWAARKMTGAAGGLYSITLTVKDSMGSSFDYYVDARCENGRVAAGSATEPYSLRIL